MKTISQCIVLFVTATLFAASTVCCIVDDRWIDHSVLNYAHTHACHATNCPVCGAQYQAQFDTQHVQKAIALASDELCAMLSLHDSNTFEPQEPFCIEFALDTSPDSDCSHQPSPIPLRI
ncbi:MAG: hypothetical protein SNJ55_00390 [Chloroherpetonaceae bacterium]